MTSEMRRLLRILIVLALFLVAALCLFGFLATFEPPGHIPLRCLYGIVGMASVVAALRFLSVGSACL